MAHLPFERLVRGLAGAALLAACSADRPTARATMPGPAPLHRSEDAAARNGECVACHVEIADEWERSLHRAAYTHHDFQSALRREPLPFCRGCHAPEADPQAPEPGLAALGVACVSCHLPAGDAVLSARPGDAPQRADHPVLRTTQFAAADACAGCHEFRFPDRRPVPEYMQTTVREMQASAHQGRGCADCHMPLVTDAGGSHRSHTFTASRDAAGMRDAFTVTATRPAPDRVELSLALRSDRIAHALPTGDLLRRLTVSVAVTGPDHHTRPQHRYLARHWQPGEGSATRTLAHDDRLGVGDNPRILTFALDPADAALPVTWQVRYERVEAFIGPGEDRARVVGGLDLYAGSLPGLAPSP